jgi:hypothetical protein
LHHIGYAQSTIFFIHSLVHLQLPKARKGPSLRLWIAGSNQTRETALTLACVIHHDGRPCDGGGLVDSKKATHWDHSKSEANFKQLDFAKVPALDIYYNSLVNLGCFVTDEERPDSDDESEKIELTFDGSIHESDRLFLNAVPACGSIPGSP